LKPSWLSPSCFYHWPYRFGYLPKWWRRGCERIESSGRNERHSERGSLLVAAIPFLLLSVALLVGAAQVSLISHRRIAMQSRLDICASQILEKRSQMLNRMKQPNRILSLTENAVLMARSLKTLGGPAGALLGTMGEAALVQLNQKTALWQDAQVRLHELNEIRAKNCSSTPHSSGWAFCIIEPSLSSLLERKRSIFPDIKSTLNIRATFSHRGRFRCIGGKLNTTLKLSQSGQKVYEE